MKYAMFSTRRLRGALVAVSCLGLASCGFSRFRGRLEPVVPLHVAQTQYGLASLYTDRRTASGERFHASALTAAHRTWPLGSNVRVTHLATGRTVIVRINDRGPFVRGRVIDLTPAAAAQIGLTRQQGIVRVKLELLKGF